MRYEHICSADRFLAVAEQWNELVTNGLEPHAYLRHEWFRAWWHAFGGDRRLSVVVVSENGRWLAAAPLSVTRRPVGPVRVRSLEFLFSGIGPRCGIILRHESPEIVAELVRGIMAIPERWTIATLELVCEDSAAFRLLPDAVRSAGCAVLTCAVKSSPYLTIDCSWDDYLGSLAQKARRNLRKAWRKTEGTGKFVRVLRITDHDELMASLPKLFQVSARSWKSAEKSDMGSPPASVQFYTELSDALSRAGGLITWILELDGKPVSMQYALLDDRKVILLRSDYDREHEDAEVGSALQGWALKDSFERGMTEFDFAGAAYWYKQRLANGMRELYAFEIYPRRPFPLLLRAARLLKRKLRARRTRIDPPDEED